MKTRLSLLLFVLLSATVSAQTTLNCDGTRADFLVKYGQAVDGDTITLADGSFTWTTGVTITKALTIKALNAPTGLASDGSLSPKVTLTGITVGGATGYFIGAVTNTTTATKLVRVSGIKLVRTTAGTGSTNGLLYVKATTAAPLMQLRLDHCYMDNGERSFYITGRVEGVIDHNVFHNCNICIGINGDDNPSWTRPINPGSNDGRLTIESNYFKMDDSVLEAPNQAVYLQEGARTTTRYNTVDAGSMTRFDYPWFDSHGNWDNAVSDACAPFPVSTSNRGQPLTEVYNNVVTVNHSYQFPDFRGGTVFLHDEDYTYITSGTNFIKLKEEEVWLTGTTWTQERTLANCGYPANDAINNSHFWNVRVRHGTGGSWTPVTNAVLQKPEEADFIQVNRDYWMSAPSATTGNPAGKYYPYSPAPFPHPLVASLDGGGAPSITSSNSATFTAGTAGTFIVTSNGTPTPTISIGGTALPTGVTFAAGVPVAGKATISASTSTTAGQTTGIILTATNTAGSGNQTFTLNINAANAPPTVTLLSPPAGTQGAAPTTVVLQSNPQDDGTITKVDYFYDTTLIQSVTSPPWSYNWLNVPAGTYVLKAVATDDGTPPLTGTSPTVTIVVPNPVPATPTPASIQVKP